MRARNQCAIFARVCPTIYLSVTSPFPSTDAFAVLMYNERKNAMRSSVRGRSTVAAALRRVCARVQPTAHEGAHPLRAPLDMCPFIPHPSPTPRPDFAPPSRSMRPGPLSRSSGAAGDSVERPALAARASFLPVTPPHPAGLGRRRPSKDPSRPCRPRPGWHGQSGPTPGPPGLAHAAQLGSEWQRPIPVLPCPIQPGTDRQVERANSPSSAPP